MNNRGRLVVDVALAVLVAILVLVLSPGLGVVAILVGLVVLFSAISFGVGALARRWRGPPVRPGGQDEGGG
ncbi:MAG: hypothetical protein QOJ25_2532 [Solirubrobacteraceae bacterium]|nr:hypothetical protein [Solirubrobacteraceae bacterium]MEA2198481.1 hypothetical protein [Solirubrobacteraceae bacterium]